MSTTKPPTWFWVASGAALVWNLLGVFAYISQVTMSSEALAALPEAQRTLLEATPAWATAAFAIAVWGGALGCVALLVRKSWAIPALVASLAGVVVQLFHSFFMSKSFEVFGPGGMIMPIMVIVIAVLLVFFARKAKATGWIG